MTKSDTLDFLPVRASARTDLTDELADGLIQAKPQGLTAMDDWETPMVGFDGTQVGSEGYLATDYPTVLE